MVHTLNVYVSNLIVNKKRGLAEWGVPFFCRYYRVKVLDYLYFLDNLDILDFLDFLGILVCCFLLVSGDR